jgi:hypothetical protein
MPSLPLKLPSTGRPLRVLFVCTGALIGLLLAANAALILHLRESELLNEESQLRSLSLILA